jgi:hypothetical protein
MMVAFNWSALRQSSWREYVFRFSFGGVATILTGVIANRYGPVVGGLFLAFPAIFPATATLVEKHERGKKKNNGMPGAKRARDAVAIEAIGTALGSLGLFGFGLIVWLLVSVAPWSGLTFAAVVWVAGSFFAWSMHRQLR